MILSLYGESEKNVTNELIYNSKRLIDLKTNKQTNKQKQLMVTKGKRCGEWMDWGSGIGIYTLLYMG